MREKQSTGMNLLTCECGQGEQVQVFRAYVDYLRECFEFGLICVSLYMEDCQGVMQRVCEASLSVANFLMRSKRELVYH